MKDIQNRSSRRCFLRSLVHWEGRPGKIKVFRTVHLLNYSFYADDSSFFVPHCSSLLFPFTRTAPSVEPSASTSTASS